MQPLPTEGPCGTETVTVSRCRRRVGRTQRRPIPNSNKGVGRLALSEAGVFVAPKLVVEMSSAAFFVRTKEIYWENLWRRSINSYASRARTKLTRAMYRHWKDARRSVVFVLVFTQPAGAQRGSDQGRPCQGLAWCSISHGSPKPRHSRRKRPPPGSFEIRRQAA